MSPAVFICSLCKNSLDSNSRTLPCFHQFCYQCLIDYFSQRQRECLGNDSFKCPNCPEDLLPADLKKCPMPKEFKLKKVMQSLKVTSFLAIWQQAMELKKKKQKCDECAVDSTMSPVRIYCKKCDQCLCEKCLENHQKFTLHTNDEIIDLTMDSKRIKKKMMPTLQCRTHKNAPFTNYCSQCRLFMCNKCVINHKLSYRDCSSATGLELLVQNKALEMHAILKNVEARQDTIINDNEDLKRMVKILPTECQAATDKILIDLEQKIALLKARASELIGDLMLFKDKQIAKLKEEIAENDHLLVNVCDLSQILTNMLSAGVKADILFSYKDIEDKWSAIEVSVIETTTETNPNRLLIKDYQHYLLPTLDIGRAKKINKLFQSVAPLQMNKASHQLNDKEEISCSNSDNNVAMTTPYMLRKDCATVKTREKSNVATVYTTLPSKEKPCVTNENNKKRTAKKNTSEEKDVTLRNEENRTTNQNKGDNSVTTNKDDLTPNNLETIVLKRSTQWPLKGNVKETYITLTKSGDLLLCDTCKKTISKYHYNGILLGECQIPGTPTAICTASDKLYFVTLPFQNLLIIVTLSDHDHSIIISKTKQKKKQYFSLCRVSHGILAGDFYGNVDLLNINGNVAKNVFISKATTMKKCYLSSAETGNIFWMLDDFDQQLSCIDLEGTFLNSFQLKGPPITSIFVDKTACLYGCDEKTIYKINSDGTLNKLWSDQNKSNKNFSLYFSPRTMKLFQCCYDKDSGFIRIFRISRKNNGKSYHVCEQIININSANGKSCSINSMIENSKKSLVEIMDLSVDKIKKKKKRKRRYFYHSKS